MSLKNYNINSNKNFIAILKMRVYFKCIKESVVFFRLFLFHFSFSQTEFAKT